MGPSWQKPLFLIVCFIMLLISIPVSFFYFSKNPLFSSQKPTTISQSTTPIITKPGNCLILEEKYCNQAKLINSQTSTRQIIRMIGFRLSPEVPVFSPSDGQISKTKLNNDVVFFKGYQAIIFNPNEPNGLRYEFSGDIKFDNMLSVSLKKGDIVGYIQDTDVDMLGYNLVFYAYNIGPDRKEIINEEVMKQIFPVIKK